jgi:hypothetical protein
MISELKDEFPEDFASVIAVECNSIEYALSAALEEFDTSSKLIGTSWFSVGLENADDAKEVDGVNKRNILLRIIDKIIGFIKMVGTKIVEWFRRCKAAIAKFFGAEHIEPAHVSERLNIIVEGMTKEDIATLVSTLSTESKTFLAEVIDKDYGDAFYALYNDYRGVGSKCDNLHKFADNYKSLVELKEKSDALKTIAVKKNFQQNGEEILKSFLLSQSNSDRVKGVTSIFNELNAVHDTTVVKLQHLLNRIPDDELSAIEGENVDHKRKEALKLISDILKIDSEIVLKVNSHMQAISMLMSYVVMHRVKHVAGIKM